MHEDGRTSWLKQIEKDHILVQVNKKILTVTFVHGGDYDSVLVMFSSRCFLCLLLKLFKVEAALMFSGREFQYLAQEYTILFLSDVVPGFGILNRNGLRIFLVNRLDTGGPI